MRGTFAIISACLLALTFSGGIAAAQTAIPKPADGQAEAPKKTAVAKKKKAAVKCEELFEAACGEASGCSWSNGLAKADGTPPRGECAKVDKTEAKATKDSCPTMFEALCKETSGCAWTAGAPGADGKAGPGACAFAGKVSKATSTKKTAAATAPKKEAAAPPVQPADAAPDAFTDQQAQ